MKVKYKILFALCQTKAREKKKKEKRQGPLLIKIYLAILNE